MGGDEVSMAVFHELSRAAGPSQQIRKSIHLHGTRRVILMLHSDCGAYGGLDGGFGGDVAAERVHHHEELRRAAENLVRAIPGVEVAGYFVDFEGVWEADLAAV